MIDYQWLAEYLQEEIHRLQKIAFGFHDGITKHENRIEKHKLVLSGDMFVENKWQHGNGIDKSEDAILNLKVMLAQVGKKIAKLKDIKEQLEQEKALH